MIREQKMLYLCLKLVMSGYGDMVWMMNLDDVELTNILFANEQITEVNLRLSN